MRVNKNDDMNIIRLFSSSSLLLCKIIKNSQGTAFIRNQRTRTYSHYHHCDKENRIMASGKKKNNAPSVSSQPGMSQTSLLTIYSTRGSSIPLQVQNQQRHTSLAADQTNNTIITDAIKLKNDEMNDEINNSTEKVQKMEENDNGNIVSSSTKRQKLNHSNDHTKVIQQEFEDVDESKDKSNVHEKQGQETNDSAIIESNSIVNQKQKSITKYVIYCDLDGVLVDFNKGVQKMFHGKLPNEILPSIFWSRITNLQNDFYRHLDWTIDGQLLWDTIRPYHPHILTGIPLANPYQLAQQKYHWCQQELCVEVQHVHMAGPKKSHQRTMNENTNNNIDKKRNFFQARSTTKTTDDKNNNSSNDTSIIVEEKIKKQPTVTKVITCWSKNKHYESRIGHVLIDDRYDFKNEWEKKGGIFIHHTNSIKTIRQLKEMNIIH